MTLLRSLLQNSATTAKKISPRGFVSNSQRRSLHQYFRKTAGTSSAFRAGAQSGENIASNFTISRQNGTTKRSLHTVALTDENVQQEFLDSPKPVILKFEASWCGPCQQLSPILKQSLETHADEKVVLATLDVDSPLGQGLAQRFGVKSIPVVFVFHKGQVISHFSGVLSQEDMDNWTQQLVQHVDGLGEEQEAEVKEQDGKKGEEHWLPADAIKNGHIKLKQGKYEEAMELFGKVVSDPTADGHHPNALAGMARASLKLGKIEDAKNCIESIPNSAYESDSGEIRSVAALVKLVEDAANVKQSKEELEKETSENKSNYQAFYDLAQLYAAEENWDESVNKALHIVRRDKSWEKGKAKDFVISVINSLGEEHEASRKARTKLANAMF